MIPAGQDQIAGFTTSLGAKTALDPFLVGILGGKTKLRLLGKDCQSLSDGHFAVNDD